MAIRTVPTCLLFAALAAGCAGVSWDQVRSEDTLAGYRRYLAEHPRSPHAAEARERVAVLQLERAPSVEALERFRREHPQSAAISDLAQRAELHLFEQARAAATPDAYDEFLTAFPTGSLASRARGNRAYLAAQGFAGRAAELEAFLRQHSESDYAADAQRSLAALAVRRSGSFGAVALRIEIAPGVAEADRLRSVLSTRAREIYERAGIRLVDGVAPASLVIRHDERPVGPQHDGEVLTRPSILAETEVALIREGSAAPEFRDVITWRVPASDVRAGTSAAFASTSAGFWERFYVPVASWPNSSAKRFAWSGGGERLAGIGAALGRATVLAPDGSFREIDFSDPANPRVVGRHVRSGTVARFSGAQRFADRIVLFGEDGAEVVAARAGRYARVASYDRGAVGDVADVELAPDGSLLLAGTQGLVRAALDGGAVERLVARPLRGIALAGDRLFVLDDRWLYSGPAADPRATQFFTALELSRGFEPRGIAMDGPVGIVFGDGGLVTFATNASGGARALSRSRTPEVGQVSDAAVMKGVGFVLTDRGLLVLDASSGRVLDSVDVDGRVALGTAGHQVVAMGRDGFEIVDAVPWIARDVPAAMAP